MSLRHQVFRFGLIIASLAIVFTAASCKKQAAGGPFELQVTSEGGGHVETASPNLVASGTVVDVTPIPDPGWVFGYWSGPNSSEVADNKVVIRSNTKVKAVFIHPRQVSLNQYKRPNPILTANPLASWEKGFVADPFLFTLKGKAWLFYEGANAKGLGRIGAAVSDDGKEFTRWSEKPVLSFGPIHLSYPQVFSDGDDIYMHVTPGGSSMLLFRTTADKFPEGWKYVGKTVTSSAHSWDERQVYDGTIFRMRGLWWMLYSGCDRTGRSRLGLAYKPSGSLTAGRWEKWDGNGSPSPLLNADTGWATGHVRMGGSVLVEGGTPFFFFQGASRGDIHLYDASNDQRVGMGSVSLPGTSGALKWRLGDAVSGQNGFVPVLTPERGRWDSLAVHHTSIVEWQGRYLAAFDGHGAADEWMIGVADIPIDELPPVAR